MNFFIKFSLKNVAAIFIITFLLIMGGLYSFSNLKMDMLPDVEDPVMTVEAIYPGASPDDINTNVTTKLEEQFKTIEGIKKVQSSSYENMAIFTLEFPNKTDMDKMEDEVNKFIDTAQLSDKVTTDVKRFSLGMIPIYDISVFAKGDTNLTEYMENEVVPALKKVPGVQNVALSGQEEKWVQITVDQQKALQHGMTLGAIKDQINQKYFSFPAGRVDTNDLQIPVRVEEKVDTIEKLENLQLMNPQQHAPVLLKDIAKVEEVKNQTEVTRYNLKDTLSLVITKKQDANTVEVADQVIKVLDKYNKKMDYFIGFDSAASVKDSVNTLVREGLLGAVFASLAVLLFLRNIRATIIAIISIPLSLLFSSIFLNQLDISLNMMTLGGMAVAVGRVVDDSIVVIENIFRRVRKSADQKITNDLIIDSTKEIMKAVVSSTLTTIVVFLPLGFVEGDTGGFFLPFALTITFALIASLLVSVTLVPILAKFSFKQVPKEEKEGFLQRNYGKLIKKSLNHKFIVICFSVLLLAGSAMLVPSLGFVFMPNEEQKTLMATIELPASTSMEKTNDVSLEIEEMFDDKKEIKDVSAAIGSRDMYSGLKKENQASYFITLKDNVDSGKFVKDLKKDMDAIMKEEDGKADAQEFSFAGPPTNSNVTIDLYSNDLDELQASAKKVEDYMKKNKDLKDVKNNLTDKERQYLVEIDSKKASEYGVAGMQVLGMISDQTTPVQVGELTLDNEEKTVQLSYNKAITAEDLQELKVFSQKGPVNLSEIADVKEINSFTSIQKLDGKVYAQISAQIVGNDISAVTKEVTEGVKNEVKLPKSVSFESGGASEETAGEFKQMGMAMASAIGLVYLIMLITFGKARIPFIILSSLTFVPIGSFAALFIAQEPLSMSAMIGFLMLIGIVVTNAIVLTDRITRNQLEKGMTIRESLIEAGKTRLRPILMTALATILSLIPLALSTSAGTLISKGLALTVIGGLTSSTLLTLVLIPVLYEIFFFKQSRKERIANS
jgi:hydrophobic/amphiphilic exporter-1 (mainly G- bacteria), HAE1 family